MSSASGWQASRFAYHAMKCVPYGRGTASLIAVNAIKQAWVSRRRDVSAVIVEKVRHALESVEMDPERGRRTC